MPNDIPNSTWSETDASNTAPVPNGAPEGWFPSDVNNWGRMSMGATKRFWDHINVTKTTGGTSTAYTLGYDVTPQQLWNGEIFTFILNADCGDAPTLNVNSLGDKTIRKFNGHTWVSLVASELQNGQVLSAYYNSNAGTFDIIAGTHDAPFSGGTLSQTTTMSGAAFNEAQGANIASATTTAIGAATGNYVVITGSTQINAFDTIQAGTRRTLEFTGTPIIANSSAIILPGGSSITAAAGDVATFISEGSGNWRCESYQRASGQAVVTPTATNGQNFLTSNVLLNSTSSYFDGPNTGSIGASGQVFEIIVNVLAKDASTAARIEFGIHNGSTLVADQIMLSTSNFGAGTGEVSGSTSAIVTLSGATTFTMKVKDQDSTSGTLLAQGSAGTANKATSISWKRLS